MTLLGKEAWICGRSHLQALILVVRSLLSFVPVAMATGTNDNNVPVAHGKGHIPGGRTRPLPVNQCGPQWSHADTVCPCATPLKLIRVWHLVSDCNARHWRFSSRTDWQNMHKFQSNPPVAMKCCRPTAPCCRDFSIYVMYTNTITISL